MSQASDARFAVPAAIATRADFSRTLRELERVDNDLESQKARAGGQKVQYLLPSMSKGLNDFLEANKIDLGNDKTRMELREQMRHLKDHAPVVQMTFASDVDPESLTWLAAWVRANLHPQALLQIGLQPGLVGGVYVRTPNHVYDFSLRGRLRGKRNVITEGLQAAVVRQGQAEQAQPQPAEGAQVWNPGKDKLFTELVNKGNPVGEIIGIDSFMIKIRGLQPTNVHALVRFEDGSRGYVHHIYEDYVIVMKLDTTKLRIGMVCVIQHSQLLTKVGKNFIGRVINIFGDPIDGKGPIEPDGVWEVFHEAPMLYERELVDTQLETGITILDINFSIVRGQRMALLGDGKVGKTALTTQIAINQKNTDITVIYVLIAKRQRDVAQLVDRLLANDAMGKAIVIVTNMFESLIATYLAPYIGAAYGEYLWQACNMDTLIVYDDLTAHAQAYREMSLIAGISPGRDSYPGDMFYTHSSLVERAGKLNVNHAAQTIIPVVYAPAGDITAYLPTNVMSMTDGQWILDMAIFKESMRPAVNTGLSVTRVGGVGQNKRQKALTALLNKTLAGYRQADEYAHFGTELSPDAQADYDKGKALFQLMNQDIGEGYSVMDQQLLLDIVLNAAPTEKIDIKKMKQLVKEYSAKVKEEGDTSNFNALRDDLKSKVVMARKAEAKANPAQSAAPAPAAEAPKEPAKDDKDKKDDKKHEKDEDKKPEEAKK